MNGFEVHVSNLMHRSEFRQFRFPVSKRKRIRIKWSKNRDNYRLYEWEDYVVMKDENKIIVGEKTFEQLKKLPSLEMFSKLSFLL